MLPLPGPATIIPPCCLPQCQIHNIKGKVMRSSAKHRMKSMIHSSFNDWRNNLESLGKSISLYNYCILK